ncbi:MAG: IS110 family transposase [Verrucomicrobiota bacterium]|nr:IS110 family transposase [Verrucomicrobiota bacterium]
MKHKPRPSKSKQILNQLTHPNAAGIDMAAEELVVAVPVDRDPEPVRTFRTTTPELMRLRDWLVACKIETVAMESTGNYWIATYQILEDAEIKVCLVNARHVKGVPGKKTDVCDAQWLQQLHQCGLLRGSFRPDKEIIPLRYVMRHRTGLIESASREIQHMQKVLTEMNLQLHHVFSDLDGESAMAIMDAIIAGRRDPEYLWTLRNNKCKCTKSRFLECIQGDWRAEYLFVLEQCQKRYRQTLKDITDCDHQIEKVVAQISVAPPPAPIITPVDPPVIKEDESVSKQSTSEIPQCKALAQISVEPPPTPMITLEITPVVKADECPSKQSTTEKAPFIRKPKPRNSRSKNEPAFNVRVEAERFYGVDLGTMDGIGSIVLVTFMSELGTGEQIREKFRSADHFASWLGLCPNNSVSAGKILGSKTRCQSNRISMVLRMAAQSLTRAECLLGEFCRRMKARLGKSEGITLSPIS